MTRNKTYQFSPAAQKELEILVAYLEKKKYSPATIQQYYNYCGLFIESMLTQKVSPEVVTYQHIRDFIFSLRHPDPMASGQLKEQMSIKQVNRVLTGIHHYYTSLDVGINPAGNLRVRGERRQPPMRFIEFDELVQLYDAYPALDDRTKRNKVILGIMIYQAITTRDLHRLDEKHIQLREGKIYIQGSRSSHHRTLDLDARQLLDLQEYILVVRPRMLEAIWSGKYLQKSGRKPAKPDPKIEQQLFFSEGGSANIKTSLHHMFKAVKKINPKIKSGQVIRAAVIGDWLKSYDVRIVQYMAGHKYVSSTERYDLYNLEDLEDGLRNYHPLK